MRAAEVPVLTLAPEATGTLRRAVVGIDFSAASVRAARTALALLEPVAGVPTPLGDGEDARRILTLVHVRSAGRRPLSGAVDRDAGYDADVRARFARLCDLLRPLAPRGVTLETRLRTGGVWARLADTVRQTHAQLVAVGTHGPGRIERPVAGSVAVDALRQMPTSVLVTPPPDATERMQLERYLAGQLTLDEPEDWYCALVASRRTARRSGSTRLPALPK
jgi:nucleotide-binding universal stress UspA family protein